MSILGILSGCLSARDVERFAKRHHLEFAASTDLELPKLLCMSTFLYLFERVELEKLFGLLNDWMLAQVADQNKILDRLICDGKTLRVSSAELYGADGATRFVTLVKLYAHELAVSTAQSSYDTGDSHDRAALRALLRTMDLEGVFIQADALHSLSAFFNTPQSSEPTCS